ncbi:hypothetical protein CYLTODRAFT_20504 [Cylindrobasidium torrendii FP15055 ss-10]|uniref:Uncharacterized protein n=1 Tax=Cylindrobasidium torrendii FP15055 ss-10 TaxID=1314674 RepID=A0A0D7B9R2_9AGAR|nr:hypothetical protein CYLTODRAFT_20504 [Cylindrobasidium torrendii FP15055 ss-10]
MKQMFRRVERESEIRAAWDRNMRRAASKTARDEEIIKHRRRSSVPNTPAVRANLVQCGVFLNLLHISAGRARRG